MINYLPFNLLDTSSNKSEVFQTNQIGSYLKVASVAIATFVFFSFQLRFSLAFAGMMTATFISLTVLSEYFLRRNSSFPTSGSNWFNSDHVSWKSLLKNFCFILSINLIAGFVFSLFNISIGQHVQDLIKKPNLRILLLATIVGPLCEEIIFRGFLKERLEDGCTLFSKFVKPLSDHSVELVSNVGQALIFGIGHMNDMQTRATNVFIFSATSLLGFTLGVFKDLQSSLISPICTHISINTAVTTRLLVFNR